ncbi:TPA: hypothetical protein SG634_001154 [Campylobacter coli]|nr:hypothetical protein [Campylobacter coli]HEH4871405.1 hypothetical protein [Campylobacter coli]HEH4956909.1 hypothetical protein [Campylobacter coli]
MLDVAVKCVQIAVSIVGIIGFSITIFQLIAVMKNTKANVLKTEMDIFGKIHEKEVAFVDAYEEYERLEKNSSNNLEKKNDLRRLYVKNKEQYLNELNLLCLYISEGYFTKEHFFQQYGQKLLSIYDEMKKDGQIKKYIHIDMICKKYKKRLSNY